MNRHNSLNNVFTEGANYNQRVRSVANGSTVEQNILQRGIVVDLKRYPETNIISSKFIPQYSLKIRLLGSNSNQQNIDTLIADTTDSWYLPLTSIHNISLPERGEEVLVIRESNKSSSKGYWISRVNETSLLNKYLKNEDYQMSSQANVGLNIDLNKLNKSGISIQNNSDKKLYGIPVFYGDVIQQGRSGSYIRHSFNKRNKKGVLEMGIVEYRPYKTIENIQNNSNIGITSTKTLHLANSNIKDIGDLVKRTNYNEVVVGPFQDGIYDLRYEDIIEKDRDIIINVADEIINFSKSSIAKKQLHRSVLGEELNDFQRKLIKILQKALENIEEMNENIELFLETFLNHTHILPEINIQIPDKELSFVDLIRSPPKLKSTGSRNVTVGEGENAKTISIPNPPRIVSGSVKRIERKKTIKYDDITIGGEGSERITTKPETVEESNIINKNIDESIINLEKRNKELYKLFVGVQSILSKVNFIN